MDKIIKNILKKIEAEGYEAYIVGGFVRDHILGIPTRDVDICTTALPMNLKQIFDIKADSNGYGGFNLKLKQYNVDITTYRKETRYDNRRPVEVTYVTNLFEDINRRDFTINALCMDKNDNIIDSLGSMKDLKDKIVRVIGDPDTKFTEDPLRMLRAIRFASILDFDIEESTYKSIERNYKLVSTLSNERIKEELTKILSNTNYKKGLKLLKDLKIDEVINLKYDSIVYTPDILGMWAQLDCSRIDFTKTEKENISKLKSLIKFNKIDNYELFNYGLYLCIVAGEILGISKQVISKKFKYLPIKSMKDIDITGSEIIKLLNIEPSKIVSDILVDVKVQILTGKLKNKKNDIKNHIVRKWKNE